MDLEQTVATGKAHGVDIAHADGALRDSDLLPRGTAVGRYLVLDRLGAGGMGVVYLAYDPELDRRVALKMVIPDREQSGLGWAQLLREAQALAKLSHPNVVTIYDFGTLAGRVWIAMELVAGETLGAWAQGRPWTDLLRVLTEVARGVAAAHAAGVVHRDLKPDNVMIGRDGRVKVMDFGLAHGRTFVTSVPGRTEIVASPGSDANAFLATLQADPRVRPEFAALAMQLSCPGSLQGTPAYMAPEQWRGQDAEAPADQFGWSVMAWELLYSERPFRGATLAELGQAVLSDDRRPPPGGRRVPIWLRRVLERGLANDPGRRWPTMGELLSALERGWSRQRSYLRIGGVTAIAAAAAAASFAVAETSAPALCPDAQAELADVWGPTRAEEAGASLRARDPEQAEPWIELITPQLDRYAEAWASMRNEACQTHREGRQSDQLFDLRTACLDRRLAGLDALADTFAAADPAALPDIARAAIELPQLDGCADVDALTAELRPPEDPLAGVTVAQLRQSLARADVLRNAGRYQDGLAMVSTVQKEADELGYLPLIAEARLQAGDLAMESSSSAEAATALDAALWTALEAGHDRVAAQASAKRAYLRATQLGEVKLGLAELDLAAPLNRHHQRDRETYAEYLHLAGGVHVVAADFTRARQLLEESLAIRRDIDRVETWKGLETLAGLAKLAEEEGDYVRMVAAYRDVVVMSAKILNTRHPAHVRYEIVLAIGLSRIGRTHEALARLKAVEPACMKIESRYACTFLLRMQANLALLVGDTDVGRASLERALAVIPDSNIERDLVLADLMYVAGLSGDAEAVRRRRQELATRQQARKEPFEGIDLYTQLRHAEALDALGRPSEALDVLLAVEASLTGFTDVMRVQEAAGTRLRLGTLRHKLGQYAAAKADLERALADLRRVVPAGSLSIAETLRMLGEVDLALGDSAAALEHLERAEALYAVSAEPEHLPLAQTRFAIARARVAVGQPAHQARSYAAGAVEPLRKNGRAAEARVVEAWLAEHP